MYSDHRRKVRFPVNCYKVLLMSLKGTLRTVFCPCTQGFSTNHVAGGKHGSKAIIRFTQRDPSSSHATQLQDAAGGDATVVAIVDDITIMGTLEALSLVEQSRALLQKPKNYLVNTDKQYVYTMNEKHVSEIQRIIYTGGECAGPARSTRDLSFFLPRIDTISLYNVFF